MKRKAQSLSLSVRAFTPHHVSPWVFSAFATFTLAGMTGCESVNIFAEPEMKAPVALQESLSVGVCMSDEDCPQWSCVTSICQEGSCLPQRRSDISFVSSGALSEEQYVSVTLRDGQLIALAGAPEESLEGPRSLGQGETLQRWLLEGDQWSLDESWSPELIRVTTRLAIGDEMGPQETREPLAMRAVTLGEDGLWIHAGDSLRDVWHGSWDQDPTQGLYYRLAAPLQSIAIDGDEAWASVFDKGLERLDLNPESDVSVDDEEETASFESNARFNTPGRALMARAGRSFVVVADGYAGLSLFNKRASSGLEEMTPARRLVTPPQELSTEGRVVHLDLVEDRVISAELGLGVGFSRINPEGGLARERTIALGGPARWVSWVDPYTALIWVEGRGLVALDTLDLKGGAELLAELPLGEGVIPASADASDWASSGADFALITPAGKLFTGALRCDGP